MSSETPQNKINTFTCPTCNGRGNIGHRPCSVCQTHGLFFWFLGHFLYWGKKISQKDIWQAKINKVIKIIFSIALFFVAVWGLFSFVTFSTEAINGKFFWQSFISIKDSRLLVFWISLWIDLFLYYRFSKKPFADNQIISSEDKTPAVYIKKHGIPSSWEDTKQIPKKLRLDISKAFSPETLQAVLVSWQVAKKLKHQEVESLHFLAASLTFEKTASIFGRLGISLKEIKEKIGSAATSFYPSKQSFLEPKISLELKKVFFKSYINAQSRGKTQVDLFDVLIVISNTESPAREVLYALDVEKDEIKNVALWVETAEQLRQATKEFSFLSLFKPSSGMNRSMTAIATPILDRSGSDLTALAQKGFLSPCVARDDEIAQILQIAESSKNGVLLVGNPGTGRTTIVNGLARRMVSEKVPKILRDKRLVNLSLAVLVSGGNSEQRISAVLNEVIRSSNVALSISDIHNMIGIQTVAGELDVSEILANVVSSGSFFIIATTTPADYKKYLEGTALDDVLEKVNINEPKGNQLIQILEVKSMPLEAKYQVFFSYDSIAAAAKLSDQYIHEKYLPEKAIAILNETAITIRKSRGQNTIIQKEDVANIVSKKTDIPLTQITEKESEKLLNLEEDIHQKMINQDPAVKAVSNALRRARAQLRDAGRPIANFLFLGPTGVGKTQLAKVVAEVYFGSNKNMIRLDMSEYQEQSSIVRLIGSPQTKSGGYLTEAVRQNPFSLILLDELEKANSEILNVFLQIMDDGRSTDGLGRVIDFTNTIIIATSNAGAQYIQDAIQKDIAYETIKRNLIENQLKASYRPEFLNRFDEIIVFSPLSQTHINQIAIILLAEVVRQMESKGIKLEITESAVIELAKAGFDPQFGARPLRRVIQEQVTNALAKYLIQGDVSRRDVVIYDVGGKITVQKAKHL